MHMPAMLFTATIPVDPMVTPANLNDSRAMNTMVGSIADQYGEEFLRSSILVFDLGYYKIERFLVLKLKGYPFVTRIKKNASYSMVREYAHSRIIRFRNGLELRPVSITHNGGERNYPTDIMDLPDEYIHLIYAGRWEIEIFFRRMKTLLKPDHLMSREDKWHNGSDICIPDSISRTPPDTGNDACIQPGRDHKDGQAWYPAAGSEEL